MRIGLLWETNISTRNTSGISCARSDRTLRDGSFEPFDALSLAHGRGRFPRHFVPGYDRYCPSGTRWQTFRKQPPTRGSFKEDDVSRWSLQNRARRTSQFGQKGHEVRKSTPIWGQKGKIGRSDLEKEQQTATDNGMNLVNGFCSTACRMASIAAQRTFRIE